MLQRVFHFETEITELFTSHVSNILHHCHVDYTANDHEWL